MYIKLTSYCIIAIMLFWACSGTEDHTSSQAPNILFCIADDASFPHMGAYGTDWVHTPAFDRVAEEGLLFTRAYTPNGKCAPSRSCIITGRNSWQLEEAANHWPYFPQKFTTYPEVLKENGYKTGFTGKGWAPGKAITTDGEPRELLGDRYSDIKLEPPAAHISNVDYAANFEAFLDELAPNQPFCFWYGSTEPHRRYEYGVGVEKGKKSLSDIDKVPGFWPDNETVRTDMLDYAYEIEYFDMHLQRMLEELEVRGMLDNTLVVVTSDNGMPFPRVKGQKYELSNHMPLAMMWKNGIEAPGRIIEDWVSLIDFAPTFMDIAGIKASTTTMQPVEGQSLTDIFYSEISGMINPQRDRVLIGKERHDVGRPGDVGYPVRGIFKGDWLYLYNFKPDRWPAGNPVTGYLNCDGSPTKTVVLNSRDQEEQRLFWQLSFGKRPQDELYNISEDPMCLINLAAVPFLSEQKQALHDELFQALKQQQDPRVMGNGDIFDQYEYANEADRNFYKRYIHGEEIQAGWVNPSDFRAVEE